MADGERPDGTQEASNGAEASAVEAAADSSTPPAFPLSKVKKIIRLDRDIKKVSNEASFLVAAATDMFLGHLASAAHLAVVRAKRRVVRVEHVRAAVKEHRPTADFLLDCLQEAAMPTPAVTARKEAKEKLPPLPSTSGKTRKIENYFQKPTPAADDVQ